MTILVCLKPNVEAADITYDRATGAPVLPATARLAAADAAALQLALDLRPAAGGTVVVLSVADDSALPFLHQALQLGADRAVHLRPAETDPALDTWSAASVAGAAAGTLGAALVLCGGRSEDLGDEFFPAALAAATGFGLVVGAISLARGADGALEAVQKLEGGWRIGHRVAAGAVVAVEAEIARARHDTVLGRAYRRGLTRAVETWTPADAGLTALPAALVEEVGLALPRARAKAVVAQTQKVSAKDRLRRKKKSPESDTTEQTLQGTPDGIAQQLLAQFDQWLA